MTKKGILLVSEVFPPRTGGSGRWFWEIYRRMPRDEVTIAAGEDAQAAEFDRTHDVRVVRVPLTLGDFGVTSRAGLGGYWRAARAIGRIVKAGAIGELHAARSLPEGWIAWFFRRRYGLPYLCYAHGEEMNLHATSRELSWMTRRVLRGARFVIANSRNTARILRDDWGLGTDRIRLLYPGADTERFVPVERDLGVRRRLGWGERRVVLTVGRLQERKGHDQMIRALGRVRQAVPDVLYAIVGDGWERSRLEQLVDQEGVREHVQFRGEISDDELIDCYQQCDLFVLPNRQVGHDIEGFGMVLLEAQACGKPVVAGASGGTAETMRVGETGLVVPCDGPDKLAEAVVELLGDEDRRRRMGQAGRQWVVERFDWAALGRQAEQLFRGDAAAGARRLSEEAVHA